MIRNSKGFCAPKLIYNAGMLWQIIKIMIILAKMLTLHTHFFKFHFQFQVLNRFSSSFSSSSTISMFKFQFLIFSYITTLVQLK